MTIGAVFAIICEQEGNNFAREGRGRSDSSISLIKLGASYVIAKISGSSIEPCKETRTDSLWQVFSLVGSKEIDNNQMMMPSR